MSTRAAVGIQHPDGSIQAIYVHSDGYLDGVGKALAQHYTEPAKVEQLVKLGDLSSLGAEIGEKHDFNTHWETLEPRDWCLAFGRDRGEKGTEAHSFASIEELREWAAQVWAEYIYLFTADGWQVDAGRGFVLLATASDGGDEDE